MLAHLKIAKPGITVKERCIRGISGKSFKILTYLSEEPIGGVLMRVKWCPFLGNPSDIDFMGAERRKTLQKMGGLALRYDDRREG